MTWSDPNNSFEVPCHMALAAESGFKGNIRERLAVFYQFLGVTNTDIFQINIGRHPYLCPEYAQEIIRTECNMLSQFAKPNPISKVFLNVAANLVHELFLSTYLGLRMGSICIPPEELRHDPGETGLSFERSRSIE